MYYIVDFGIARFVTTAFRCIETPRKSLTLVLSLNILRYRYSSKPILSLIITKCISLSLHGLNTTAYYNDPVVFDKQLTLTNNRVTTISSPKIAII